MVVREFILPTKFRLFFLILYYSQEGGLRPPSRSLLRGAGVQAHDCRGASGPPPAPLQPVAEVQREQGITVIKYSSLEGGTKASYLGIISDSHPTPQAHLRGPGNTRGLYSSLQVPN